MEEIWKDVAGWNGQYKVSSLGNVYSKTANRNLKQSTSHGYPIIGLYNSNTKKTLSVCVHKLMAEVFLNHKFSGWNNGVIDHIDNNRANNNINNLRIVSVRENTNMSHIKSSSKYIGVSYCSQTRKWKSTIQINGLSISIGRFDDESKAAKAYKIALKMEGLFNGNRGTFRRDVKLLM